MKKNKLFAVLAAATLLVGTGSTVLPNNNAVAQAATKKKTSAKRQLHLKDIRLLLRESLKLTIKP